MERTHQSYQKKEIIIPIVRRKQRKDSIIFSRKGSAARGILESYTPSVRFSKSPNHSPPLPVNLASLRNWQSRSVAGLAASPIIKLKKCKERETDNKRQQSFRISLPKNGLSFSERKKAKEQVLEQDSNSEMSSSENFFERKNSKFIKTRQGLVRMVNKHDNQPSVNNLTLRDGLSKEDRKKIKMRKDQLALKVLMTAHTYIDDYVDILKGIQNVKFNRSWMAEQLIIMSQHSVSARFTRIFTSLFVKGQYLKSLDSLNKSELIEAFLHGAEDYKGEDQLNLLLTEMGMMKQILSDFVCEMKAKYFDKVAVESWDRFNKITRKNLTSSLIKQMDQVEKKSGMLDRFTDVLATGSLTNGIHVEREIEGVKHQGIELKHLSLNVTKMNSKVSTALKHFELMRKTMRSKNYK